MFDGCWGIGQRGSRRAERRSARAYTMSKSGQMEIPRTIERCCDRLTKDYVCSKIVYKVDLDKTELQCLWYDAGITSISCKAYLRQ